MEVDGNMYITREDSTHSQTACKSCFDAKSREGSTNSQTACKSGFDAKAICTQLPTTPASA